MKKTKRYSGEDGISDVEDMKASANEGKGIFSGAAAEEDDTYAPKTRTFSTTGPEKRRPKVQKPTPKGSQSFPISVSPTENAGDAMRRGQAGQRPTQRMTNAPLDKLMGDRKTAAYNAERKANAEERKKTARSTTSEVPYDSVNPNQYKMFEKDSYKKGGSVGSASKRADGCAQKGKTKGRMV